MMIVFRKTKSPCGSMWYDHRIFYFEFGDIKMKLHKCWILDSFRYTEVELPVRTSSILANFILNGHYTRKDTS